MRWRMMICERISHIGVTWCPTNIELVMFHSVFDPVESHIHCLWELLLDCVIDNAILWCCQFRVLWRPACDPFQKSVVRVVVPSFALTKSAPNWASATDDTTCVSTVVWNKSGPLDRGFLGGACFVTQVEVTANSWLSLWLREVRGIAFWAVLW
jgi:hypothetical protein